MVTKWHVQVLGTYAHEAPSEVAPPIPSALGCLLKMGMSNAGRMSLMTNMHAIFSVALVTVFVEP